MAAVLIVAAADAGSADRIGTVPAWISAVGGALGFTLTGMVFVQGRRDKVRAQAEAVYATVEIVDGAAQERVMRRGVVHNSSDAPIWNVELRPRRNGKLYADGLYQGKPDVQPHKSTPTDLWEWEAEPEEGVGTSRQPLIAFVDSSGRRWEKTGSALVRVGPLRTGARRLIRRARAG